MLAVENWRSGAWKLRVFRVFVLKQTPAAGQSERRRNTTARKEVINECPGAGCNFPIEVTKGSAKKTIALAGPDFRDHAEIAPTHIKP
jgi:hypothetical protein